DVGHAVHLILRFRGLLTVACIRQGPNPYSSFRAVAGSLRSSCIARTFLQQGDVLLLLYISTLCYGEAKSTRKRKNFEARIAAKIHPRRLATKETRSQVLGIISGTPHFAFLARRLGCLAHGCLQAPTPAVCRRPVPAQAGGLSVARDGCS